MPGSFRSADRFAASVTLPDGAAAFDVDRMRAAEVDRDVAQALQARFEFLAEASRCLADSLDYVTTLATVARLALPHLGAWCMVDVVENAAAGPIDRAAPQIGPGAPGLTIRRLAVLHPDPAKQALARELHERYPPAPTDVLGAPRVIRNERPEIVLAVPDAALEASAQDAEHLRLLRALGMGAYMIVPMVARGHVVGAITFVAADGAEAFADADVLLAEDLAWRCAIAVDNARLYHVALGARAHATAASTEARLDAARAEAAMRTAEEATRIAVEATRIAHEARDVAAAANRAKAEFLAVMSHELRTPLNAIGGYAELLELGIRGPMTVAQLEDLQRIQRAQRHLAGLIDQVLGYARIEAGRERCELADVDVHQAVLTAEVLVSPQIRAKRLSCEWRSCDVGATVRADPAWMHQILVNLLANAVKFTEPDGRVDILCSVFDERVEVRVRDTGIGIAPDKLEAIFEPFVQIGRRLNDPRPHEGVGLGLAISRDLARRMNCELMVTSEEGRGSTFTLTMPRTSVAA